MAAKLGNYFSGLPFENTLHFLNFKKIELAKIILNRVNYL